jgi:hypothetical protein
MNYWKIRDSLKTGDILLFRAGTTLAGRVVGWVSHSPFSHVAMVVRYQNDLCMWESGRDDLDDVIRHRKLAGAHLARLDELLYAYTKVWDGDFVLRRLEPPLTDEAQTEIDRWMERRAGTPFPALWQIVIDQVQALVDPTKMNRASYACAELIADTIQRVNLLALDKPSESYSARDFSKSGTVSLQFGHSLGDEELVTFEKPAEAHPEHEKLFMALPTAVQPGAPVDWIVLPRT